MLSDSILGRVYRCWLESWVFSLLRGLWHWLSRQARESRILRLVFGASPLDRAFSDSGLARAVRALLHGILWLLRPIARGIRESAICAPLRRAFAGSWLVHFEPLFAAFCCAMFIVPHDDWNNTWALIAAVLFLGAYLLLCAGGAKHFVAPDKLGLAFALFVLSCVLSLLYTRARGDSLRVLVIFFTGFLFFYLTAFNFDSREKLRVLLGFLYVSLLAVCCLAIAQRAFHLISVNSSYTDTRINAGVPARVYGTLDNPANLSGFIQLFLPLSAAYAIGADRSWKRVVLSFGLLIPLLAMVMTYARAGWVSVLLAAFILVYFSEKKVIPLLVIAGIFCIPFLPQSILIRLSTIGNSMDSSTTHRLALWKGVLLILKDYLPAGIGLGPDTFKLIYPDYAQLGAKTGAYHSQMMYMELLLEMGVLGFLSFLWMMCKHAGRAGRAIRLCRDRSLRLILAACIGTMAALAFSQAFEYLWFYQRCIFAFFLWLGIGVAAMRIAEKEGSEVRDQRSGVSAL